MIVERPADLMGETSQQLFLQKGLGSMGWVTIVASLSVIVLLLAAWNDIATRLIPDCLSIAIAVLGATTRLMIGPTALSLSVAVALGVFAFLLFLHARGGLGGGDVKLAAAVCVGLPPAEVWRFIIVTSLAGGILAVLHLLGRLALRRSGASPPAPAGSSPLIRVLRTERWRIARGGPLSYGVAIACGGIWAILESRGF